MDTKHKYVRLKQFNEIIIFPTVINHDDFKNWDVISAGFCYINADRKCVSCFGESISLKLKSDPIEDTKCATRQVFGWEAVDDLKFD